MLVVIPISTDPGGFPSYTATGGGGGGAGNTPKSGKKSGGPVVDLEKTALLDLEPKVMHRHLLDMVMMVVVLVVTSSGGGGAGSFTITPKYPGTRYWW